MILYNTLIYLHIYADPHCQSRAKKTTKARITPCMSRGHLNRMLLTEFFLRRQDIDPPSWEDDDHQTDGPGDVPAMQMFKISSE